MNLRQLERALRKHDEDCATEKEFGREEIDLFIASANEAVEQGGEIRVALKEGGGYALEVIYRKPVYPGVEQQ